MNNIRLFNFKCLPTLCVVIGLALTSCNSNDDPPKTNWGITVNTEMIALDLKTNTISETIIPSTTENGASYSEDYKFTSSNLLIATVNKDGLVTAVAAGRSSILVEGLSSGAKASVLVDVDGVGLSDFTEQYNLDGSVAFNWNTTEVKVNEVKVYSGDGSVLLTEGDEMDYTILKSFDTGVFELKPGNTDSFDAGVEVNVAITIDDKGTRVIKLITLPKPLSSTVTIKGATLQWDKKSPESGVLPKGVKVFTRVGDGNDESPFAKGELTTDAQIGQVEGDTLIYIQNLESNTGYWFELIDENGIVLAETNNKIPTPITQVKAGQIGSIWYESSSGRLGTNEVRRIADRVSIGNGITGDDIKSVELLNKEGEVVASLGEVNSKENTNYEYAYINDNAPINFKSITEAIEPKALYVHDKVDPDDGANGEFKHVSFYDVPHSETPYTVVLTDKDGKKYKKEYSTKATASTRNRSQIRSSNKIYSGMEEVNAMNLVFMVHSNIPNDSWTFTTDDSAVATIDDTGLITYVANGACKAKAVSQAKTFEFEIAAAQTYCNNYSNFRALPIGETKGMSFWSPNGYQFESATSSNPSIAIVDGSDVTAVAEGTAVITIADNQGNTAKMTVTVVVKQ